MVTIVRRASKNRKLLHVWVNGLQAAVWEYRKHDKQRFWYHESWVNHPQGRALSLSLPFLPGNPVFEGDVVESFFDNLLPDNKEIRRRIQHNFSVKSLSVFDLLEAVGGDCVGAIQLLPEGQEPVGWKKVHARALTDLEVEQHLKAAVSKNFLGEKQDEFRISIAGAQEKTALLWHDKQWHIPLGVTPTTHIFKLPLGLVGNMRADMSTSVENEWLCSKIMAAYGIPTAHCEMAQFGETRVLVVERFDRKLSSDGQYWLRLPQEDMCQALAKPPELKYESEGGAGMSSILELLRGSHCAEQDRINFYKTQIVFWMLAATDGHAKNFSLFHEKGGMYRMTPIYDVLSVWPIIGEDSGHLSWHDAKLAMGFRSKNTHYKLKDINPRHFLTVANKLGLGGEVDTMIHDILTLTPRVLSDVEAMLPRGFPSEVAEPIFKGLEKSAYSIRVYMESLTA